MYIYGYIMLRDIRNSNLIFEIYLRLSCTTFVSVCTISIIVCIKNEKTIIRILKLECWWDSRPSSIFLYWKNLTQLFVGTANIIACTQSGKTLQSILVNGIACLKHLHYRLKKKQLGAIVWIANFIICTQIFKPLVTGVSVKISDKPGVFLSLEK